MRKLINNMELLLDGSMNNRIGLLILALMAIVFSVAACFSLRHTKLRKTIRLYIEKNPHSIRHIRRREIGRWSDHGIENSLKDKVTDSVLKEHTDYSKRVVERYVLKEIRRIIK